MEKHEHRSGDLESDMELEPMSFTSCERTLKHTPGAASVAIAALSLALHACGYRSTVGTDAAVADATVGTDAAVADASEGLDAPIAADGGPCEEATRMLHDDLLDLVGSCSFVLSYDAATDRIDGVAFLGCAPCCPFVSADAARTAVVAQTGHDADGVVEIYRGEATYYLYYEATPPPAVALIEPYDSGRVVVSAALPTESTPGRLEIPSTFAPNEWPACPPARFLMSFDALDLSTGARLPDGGRLPLEAFRRTPLAHHLAHVFGHASAIAARVEADGEEVWVVIVEAGNTGD